MEIKEKVKLRFNFKEEEVEARIDTGAEVTMIDEEILKRLEVTHVANRAIDFGGVSKVFMPVYRLVDIQIRDCVINFPDVLGGKKNLIGHDILQKAKAVIDEGKGTIEFPEDDGTIEM